MSGDVQPRKRRDKKKKKEDFEETAPHPFHARAPTPPDISDEVIHVYKESSTGGGICAKIVFFILLSILAVLIGLIITEHRGLTNLDTIESETRFSQIFEGWVDKTPESHDDDAHHAIESHEHDDEEHDDHDEPDEHEGDDHDDEDDHDDHDDEEEEHASEEEDEEVAASEEEEVAASEDEEEEPSAQQDDDDEEEEEEKSATAEEEDEDETAESEQPDDEDEEDQTSAPASAEAQDDDDDEDDDKSNADDDDDEAALDSKPDEDSADADDQASTEAASEEKDEEQDDDDDDDDEQQISAEENKDADDDDDDDDEETPEAGEDEKPDEDAEGDESNTGVVVKVGVGVTILVVAYVVLVRKWKSDNSNADAKAEKKEVPVDLSRRNTIVVPPKVEEVEQVIDNDDEEYSEEEEEEIIFHPKLKQDYQQLRSTYERSLTPESDPDTREKPYDYEDEGEEDVEYDEEEVEGDDNVDEEEEAEEEEPVSDIDDEDLLKKLEAKYGKLESTHADAEEEEEEEEEEAEGEESEEEEDEDGHFQWKRSKPSGAQAQLSEDETEPAYEFENLTNDEDYDIKDQLDEAHEHIETNAALAMSLFNKILLQHPSSPRALYGKAKSLDNLADKQRSNELLKEAITTYFNLLKSPNVPPALIIATGERCIDRTRFIGQYGRAAVVHNILINQFPDEIKYRNQLAVTYLMGNRISEARTVLKETLKLWPGDGFALVHYGFILKVNDDKLNESVDYLKRGLKSKATGVVDGRFYFHLGDALIRLGRPNEAAEVYNEGVANKVFLSFYQRSLYNVNRLTGRPWWNKGHTPQYKQFYEVLEKNYLAIKKEGMALLNGKGFFQDEAENLRDVGEWKQFELFARGMRKKENCKKCPLTCKLVESLPDAIGCRRGQIKFSVMHPGTHVWPHCGPTNCRLRVHLGLKVPKNTFIRVAKETRSWEEGKVLIFDDSFEHEVWHNGTETRLVLIVDVWHPELTRMEKQSLSAI